MLNKKPHIIILLFSVSTTFAQTEENCGLSGFEAGDDPNLHSFTTDKEYDLTSCFSHTLSSILCAYDLQHVTLQSSKNGNIEKTLQDTLSTLSSYGCWCGNGFGESVFKGRPVDHVDTLCKSWTQCTKCETLSSCEGSIGDDYTISFIPASDTFSCESASECGYSRCMCNGKLGIDIARSLIIHSLSLNERNFGVSQDSCVLGESINTNHGTDCCGTVPNWKPYNTDVHSCVNGQLHLAGYIAPTTTSGNIETTEFLTEIPTTVISTTTCLFVCLFVFRVRTSTLSASLAIEESRRTFFRFFAPFL